MVVTNVRIDRRYSDSVSAVVFTEADNPQETDVTVWACKKIVGPEEGLVLVLPRRTEMTDVEVLLDAGYTVRIAPPDPVDES